VVVGAALFAAGLFCVVGAAAVLLWKVVRNPAIENGATYLAGATLLYASSHCARVVRLAVLIGDPLVSLREIGLVHFLSVAVSYMSPFKLGEAFRVFETGHLLHNGGLALVIVWVERAFDFAVIALLVAVASATTTGLFGTIQPLILLSAMFVISTVFLFAVAPEALRALNLFVVRKYEGQRAIRRLKIIQWLQGWIALGPRVVSRRMAPLAALTCLIWGLELATLAVLLPTRGQDLAKLAAALPMFLSAASWGGVLLAGPVGDDYALVVSWTMLALGVVAGLLYAPTRFRTARSRLHAAGQPVRLQ